MGEGGNKSDKVPEWSIFDRLDEVENITLNLMDKSELTEPTLKKTVNLALEARMLSVMAFLYAYLDHITEMPWEAQKTQDFWIEMFKNVGISRESLFILKKGMEELYKRSTNNIE